jgi:plastocyanin
MGTKHVAVALAVVGLGVSACGGRPIGSSASAGSTVLPTVNSDLVMFATLPGHTIGEELPREGLGKIYDKKWKATLGGFTQRNYSQALGFPPGTKITIRNLSHNITHTLDVVKEITGPPAHFPQNPHLSTQAQGNGKMATGYASGPIKPGKSVTVTLVKKGIYLIGCAYHYDEGMRDVIVIGRFAQPGPQGTPPPTSGPTSSPTPRSSYDP